MFFLILPLFFLLSFNVFSIDVIKIGIVDFDRIVIEVLNPQLKANLDRSNKKSVSRTNKYVKFRA